ncbi:MAG TPA: tetratricopeptide repeat protein [Terriglobia bacterium]|nr:tetratricopeptide repeat protein [Terriglobia bacterium]
MRRFKLAPLCAVLLLAVVAGGCNALSALKARDQLHKGVDSYKNGRFQEAIEHFKSAIQLDQSLINARLYLATAYAQQYVPGGDTPENLKTGQQAIDAFEDVLKMDSKNTTALASIGQIYYNMKNFDKAKEFQRQRMQVEPNNPEPYYWIGVIDWAQAFQADGKIRKQLNLQVPNKNGNLPPLPEKYRSPLAEQNGKLIDEGIEALNKAVELKPNDVNSMAYLNLLYRQKADIEQRPADREADLKSAESWLQKSMELRKSQPATPPSQGS